ncbi:nitroreductase family deazaflavin-dependent oxidoreductase [Rhodococcus sp. NPDC003318]|uniref:nitroreductase family deazaflavin-dependent oxidoreductase n=1 Tax=Rhodococcus sp. NPDC003318 TaxID=3364503 RepID=UPI0036AFFD75
MLPRQLAKFNRLITNRTYGRLAGHAPWMGIVVHRGRRSRREYRTPVNVHPFADGYRISLDYGPESDWVQNVVAQGGCSLVTRGKIVELVAPQVIQDTEANWAPTAARRILEKVGSGYYLQLRYVD